MAPIPALWVAASLAHANVVAVGDYKQLPPIVMSTQDEAQRWLGRDVFEAADIRDHRTAPAHFVALTEQFRMHPDSSALPNALVYDGLLRDGPGTADDSRLFTWYRTDWGHDEPVLCVDTGTTDAWVTSVVRGERAKPPQLPFRHDFRVSTSPSNWLKPAGRSLSREHPRGFTASPYRAHATLVELLLRDSGLSGEVRAGTAHTFQGSEADVVILDLVNDEPHWKVNLFTPGLDESSRRLLNVALTQHAVDSIVVGDFEYNARVGGKAFLGQRLMPALRNHLVVDALDIVPVGLAARAAAAQSGVLGGEVEPDANRVVVNQSHFFSMLAGDLSRARHRVVVYSPFITENRLALLEPQLKAVIARDVDVYVVTKATGDRAARDRGAIA